MTTGGMSLRQAAGVINKHARLVVGSFGACVLGAIALTLIPAETYFAESHVAIHDSPAQEILGLGTAAQLLDREVSNELGFARGDAVLGQLEGFAGEQLDDDVEIRADLASDLIRFEVTGPTPELAARRANVLAELYVDARREAALTNIGGAIAGLEQRLEAKQLEREDIASPIIRIEVMRRISSETEIPAVEAELRLATARLAPDLAVVDSQIESINNSLATLQVAGNLASEGSADITLTATPPSSGSHSLLGRNILLGALAGLVLSALAVAIREVTDTKIRSVADIEAIAPLPILGEIPKVGNDFSPTQLATASVDGRNFLSGAYDRVRLTLQKKIEEQSLYLVSVTSPTPRSGATTSALNLAACMAGAGVKSSVVEANFRRPAFSQLLGRGEVLNSEFDVVPEGRQFDHLGWHPSVKLPNLNVMSLGDSGTDHLSLVRSDKVGDLLHTVAAKADVTLVDGPPVLILPDGFQMARLVPNAVLVIRSGQTTKADLVETLESFQLTGTEVLGVVLVGSHIYRHDQVRSRVVRSLQRLVQLS